MVAELATCGVFLLAAVAEWIHSLRIRRVATLAFGPRRRPAVWATCAPLLRVAAHSGLCWGLVTLLLLSPKVHRGDIIPENQYKHVVLILDVSPSMRLQDAGPDKDKSRMNRAQSVMESFFQRVAIQQYRITVVATYNGAKPVVVDTKDIEVVRNILSDLPMHYAFPSGKTDIFAGLAEAAAIAKNWNPKSTTFILVSDGDTVPATGMPKMPASVRDVLVIGIGDPVKGKFIDGKHSRQEVSTLRQIATRLGGVYHNGNEKHLSTDLLNQLTHTSSSGVLAQLTRREYALISCTISSITLALLPLLLHFFATAWKPGANRREPVASLQELAI